MAKLFGLSGRVTGRKGDTVFSVRKGEQVIRQYNPMVLNPNTEAQTVQRAKMKLSSQLGAIFANVIAIPSNGAKTSRNIFTKTNFPLITRDTTVEGIKVQADLPNIQLTKSGRAMCPIGVYRRNQYQAIAVTLLRNCSTLYDRVVYVMVAVQEDGTMRVLTSAVVNEAGINGNFYHSFQNPGVAVLIYAYGIKDLNSAATTTFENTEYEDGTDIASLISGRVVSANDAQVTRTVGVLFGASDTRVTSDGSFCTLLTFGNMSNVEEMPDQLFGAGVNVKIQCWPAEGYHFDHWTMQSAAVGIDLTVNPTSYRTPTDANSSVSMNPHVVAD